MLVTELWGIQSHGLIRIPLYVRRLLDGGTNPKAVLRPLQQSSSTVVYDGGSGMGHWQVWEAALAATSRAEREGVGVAAVADSSHCGSLGLYTFPATDAGFVGIVFSNGPAVMPPPGGSTPVLSTSPIAAGIPLGKTAAVVDLALSAVARGRVLAAAARGETLPDGWAFDKQGIPTSDANAAISGMLAPMGGAKGFALAFLVEALTGALVGPNLSIAVADMLSSDDTAKPQGIAHLVIALNPEFFGQSRIAVDRFAQLAREIADAGGRPPGITRSHPDRLDPRAPIQLEQISLDAIRKGKDVLNATGK